MKKNYLLITVAFICQAATIKAQTPNWLWAKGLGGTIGAAWSIAVDGSSNSYTTGTFTDTLDFDPGPGVYNLTSVGVDDSYLLKLDALGNFVWVKQMGGSGDQYGYRVVLDASGNIYTIGEFGGTPDFDPGPGVFNLTSAGGNDIYIVKLSSGGNFIWAKAFSGTSSEYARALAVDATGNVYMSGSISGTTDFDPGSGVYNLTTATAGFTDIFISRLDSAGNFVWAKTIGGAHNDNGQGIAVDPSANGMVYVTGYFHDTADFDPGSGTANLVANGSGSDVFICKFDSAGDFAWAKRFGGVSTDDGHGIALDGLGNVYATGWFFATVDFDPGAGVFNLSSLGFDDVYIFKCDTAGNFKWVKRFGGVDYQSGYSIAVAPGANGGIYTQGRFAGTADFNPGTGIFNLTSVGLEDVYVCKLDTAGSFIWAKAIGSTDNEFCESIAVDAGGSTYITGFSYGTSIAFDSTILTNARTFIARLDTAVNTGSNEIENSSSNILLSPNPAVNHLTIAWRSTHRKVEVIIADITGKIIYATTVAEAQKVEVNLKDLAEGVYVLQIHSSDFAETKKLIVTK